MSTRLTNRATPAIDLMKAVKASCAAEANHRLLLAAVRKVMASAEPTYNDASSIWISGESYADLSAALVKAEGGVL